MSYYDSTVASYENQISNNNTKISECNEMILKLDDDVDELMHLREKVTKIENEVETASKNTSNKINNLQNVIFNPLALLKMNYFSSFLDVIEGAHRVKANDSITGALKKINDKIRELQDEIQNMKNEIGRCDSNISSLNRQKQSYISDMEKKNAEKAAAQQKAAESLPKATEDSAKSPAASVNTQTNSFVNDIAAMINKAIHKNKK